MIRGSPSPFPTVDSYDIYIYRKLPRVTGSPQRWRRKMFFFFVGGVEQQVARVLKEGAGRCFACGSQADLVEIEKVLKLFFVPVWRWPGKDPAMRCESCRSIFPPSFSLPPAGEESSAAPAASPPRLSPLLKCYSCDRPVERGFRFCPFCGTAL